MTGTGIARTERRELCDLMASVGPDAPTLCEGWTVYHLATHLHLRESDPVVGLGIALPPLKGVVERRMERFMVEHEFDNVVEMVRRGPGRIHPMGWPGVDELVNSLEFFVHHEDVRRGGFRVVGPRVLPPATDDFLWERAVKMATVRLRRSRDGVLLQRVRDGRPTDEQVVVSTGRTPVTVRGEGSELVLWLFGRGRAAELEFIGDAEPAARVQGLKLSV